MKRGRTELPFSFSRQKLFQLLVVIAFSIYVLFLFYEVPHIITTISSSLSGSESSAGVGGFIADTIPRVLPLDSSQETVNRKAPARPTLLTRRVVQPPPSRERRRRPARSGLQVSGLVFQEISGNKGAFSELHRAAADAWRVGGKMFADLQAGKLAALDSAAAENKTRSAQESCTHSIMLWGAEFREKGKVLVLPCGLTLGSHITLVATPHRAHPEYDPKITLPKEGDPPVMVSQFMMELQGLKIVDGEDPPRILHFNPRLKGDWSGKPIIEQNTCYRMQWGSAQRCEGWKSRADEETVDGLVKCEKWIRDDDDHTEESKTTWWLNRLIGRTKTVSFDWPYPFVEDKMFVLTLSAGLEGYHVNVDGRHITSFPYRTGFVLEDATGLSLNGDLDIQSIFAGSLPTTHPSFSPHRHLEMDRQWKAPLVPDGPIELFIGILSAGNHFAERMAVRKSWMQSIVGSQNVVARFFVAMNGRKEVNVELKREAEFFGDIVIVPFMDSYDLVVLKTVAICEYGVRVLSAKNIMKCDDDTFVRIDSVMKEVKKVPRRKSLYIGNINYYHKPLRDGKWAVTYEEWPEEDYPPYANGPGYVVSSDIAKFIVAEFEKHTLRLFKMEDVSMGMWVEQFNSSRPVEYVHDIKFCQFGCIDEYLTAHYQSPRQMICMWEKLRSGKPQCCNVR